MIPVTLLDLSNITYARACWTYWLDVQLVLKRYCPLPPHLTEARKTHKCHENGYLSVGRQPLTEFVIGVAPVDGPSGEVLSWNRPDLVNPGLIPTENNLWNPVFISFPRSRLFSQLVVTDFCKWRRLSLCCWYHCYILLPYSAPVNYESVPAWHSSKKVFFWVWIHLPNMTCPTFGPCKVGCFFKAYPDGSLFCIFQNWEVSWVYNMIFKICYV